MATRYWVGGAGNWSSTTKWSATSGGASGASVPISTDDVVFDANSGLVAATATVDTAQTCATLTLTPGATVGLSVIAITVSLTVTGLFSMSGTAGNQRFLIRGTTYGLATNFIVGSASGLSDLDFRDLLVTGAASPLSGTRIGDLRGVTGVTFSTPKTVYWNLAGAQNWSANGWAATSGGSPATTNFPLAQDTAVFDNTGSVTGTITLDAALVNVSGIDMSNRSSAMTLALGTNIFIYGNFTCGSGTTISGTTTLTFSGRKTQTITSAGKTLTPPLTIDTYGGTVQLADALNIGTNALTVTNGTFTTNGYSVTAGSLSSSNSNVRAINLGASTITTSSNSPVFTTSTNLTFNAGTSLMSLGGNNIAFAGGGMTFYNVTFTGTAASTKTITGLNTFANLTVTAPASAGLTQCTFSADQTITNTLTCAGASAVQRVFLQSSTLGTQRTLTVGTLSAQDCDFRDIVIAGAAAGSSPTRAGDCGGNSGITFPAPKTVYWNLAGSQNWSATGWCSSSGGTPDINQFPLAQDTAVIDDAGSVGPDLTINAAWNIGTFNSSARTTAVNINTSTNNSTVYGDWIFGSGATSTNATGTITFSKRGIQTITSNGKEFGCPININSSTGTVQIADALSIRSTRTLTLSSGTFNAVTYNVTVGGFFASATGNVYMGTGTWTLSGTGTVFDGSSTIFLYKQSANIVLSDNTTTSRTFSASNLSFNKLTIGGNTSTSTTTLTNPGNVYFGEIASTKTVAHTIALPAGAQLFNIGAWSVTGSIGNVVTVTGGSTIALYGSRVTGIDYLALGTTVFDATNSSAEFYAGANSTGGTGFILSAAPAATSRYWVGGTGTWDAATTTNWSASSGGSGGASVPTSADAVIFDSASNATAYTVTCTATALRCASLTMSGPASGNVTWAGFAPIFFHDNVVLSATGITTTYNGAITLSGSATGKSFTTNGSGLASVTIRGYGCAWALGSALSLSSNFTLTDGSFDTAGLSLTVAGISVPFGGTVNYRTLSFSSSTISVSANVNIYDPPRNLTVNSGTSTINASSTSPTMSLSGYSYNNFNFTSTTLSGITITGANTFANLSITGRTTSGINPVSFSANQTITGTLTLSAGTNATMRTFVQSDTIGTPRTLTCAAVSSLTDIDFRDITIAGAAAPVSGTRLGDCKGNSGITFDAAKTVYRVGSGANWSSNNNWSNSSGGTGNDIYFPLAQDTAVFDNNSGATGMTKNLNTNYNVGTIDMSARTTNTMTLATASNTPTIYGNWINGTGTTLTGTGTVTFAGRGSQTITSAGKTFTQPFTINTPAGSVTLQDDYNCSAASGALIFVSGTFDANNKNVTLAYQVNMGAGTKTIAIGSGTWTIAGSGSSAWSTVAAGLTVTGTGTISLTSASAKTFAGGSLSYSGITLNQGGAGALTIGGNNTFANITSSYSSIGNTTISFASTSTTLSQFTAAGTAGNLLAINGTSAGVPATLIYNGGSTVNSNYLTINNVKAYATTSTWYAGANSTNGGTLGWIFTAAPVVSYGRSFGWIIT